MKLIFILCAVFAGCSAEVAPDAAREAGACPWTMRGQQFVHLDGACLQVCLPLVDASPWLRCPAGQSCTDSPRGTVCR